MFEDLQKIYLKIDEIATFDFPKNELFFLTVNYKNAKYEFLIKIPENNKKIISFGSGAAMRKANAREGQNYQEPPVFNRWSWNGLFDATTIFYSDPSLYLGEILGVGWCAGTPDDWYLKNIGTMIDLIKQNIGSSDEDLIFFGSSGGRFTSIALATLFRNSQAIVDIPQINLHNFSPAHVERMMKICFPEMDDEEMKKHEYKINLLALFEKCSYIPKIKYLCNMNSTDDVLDHAIPLAKFLAETGENIEKSYVEFLFYDGEYSHQPLGNDETVKIINDALNEIEGESNEDNLIEKEEIKENTSYFKKIKGILSSKK